MPFKSFLSHRYLEKVAEEEAAIEYGEHLLRTVSSKSFRRSRDGSRSVKGLKSLREKLKELELTEKCHPDYPEFRPNLLQRLVRKEQLNLVILNLYPGDYGFTVEISGREYSSPPMVLSYEDPWLESFDRGELHPAVVDLLANVDVFYDGCVIVEVRDHRRSDPTAIESNASTYNSHYVVLKPTTQTLVADLSVLAPENNNEWSYDDRQALESMLLCATSEPLCLDPSPSVAIVANRIQYNKNNLHRSSLKRMAKELSQVTVNKRKRLADVPLPPYLQSYEYLFKKKKDFAKPVLKKISFPCEAEFPDIDNYDFLSEGVNICKLPFGANFSPLPQEYQEKFIKIQRDPGGIQCAKISVKEVPEGRFFEVTPYLSCNGQDDFKRSPSFKLKSKELVIKYLDQFTETFTEKGKLTIENNEECERKVVYPSLVEALASATSMSSVVPTKAPSIFTVESIMSSSKTPHNLTVYGDGVTSGNVREKIPHYSCVRTPSPRLPMAVSPRSDDSTGLYKSPVRQDTVIFPGPSVINNASLNFSNSMLSSAAVSAQPVSMISPAYASRPSDTYSRRSSDNFAGISSCLPN